MEMEAGKMSKAERKTMMKEMMPQMLEGMGPEDLMEIMSEMMPLMMEKMTKDDPTMAKQTLTTMMPVMMESFSGGAQSKDMMEAMHEVAPKMMETCMESMKNDERREMLSFCRGMLDSLEKRFIQTDDSPKSNA